MATNNMWRNILLTIAVGKAAVAGAGLALALLGVLGVASAIGAHDTLVAFQKEYFDWVAFGGGVVGAGAKIIWDALA